MVKRVWISAIHGLETEVRTLVTILKNYGLEGQGHVWMDDVSQMAWMGPRDELLKPETSMWVVLAAPDDLQSESIGYGLAVLALSVQAQRGKDFPIVFLFKQAPESWPVLPTPFQNAAVLDLNDPGFGPRMVALVHKKRGKLSTDYYCDVYGSPQLGQWFEVGPHAEHWTGALFAVSQGEILLHAVGPRGVLPERSTLEYPTKGIKIEAQERAYTAWACQNRLSENESYFLKVDGSPGSILFGPFAETDEPEFFVLHLLHGR